VPAERLGGNEELGHEVGYKSDLRSGAGERPMPTREFKMTIQTDIVAIIFIAASIYFAAGAIFERFGAIAGYAYCVIGIVLIVVQLVRLLAYY
jgi:hypothetical protein